MIPLWVPKTKLGFIGSLAVALVFSGASVGYLVWRQDKPLGNPGGPIGSMGEWYVFWNWIAIGPGPMLSAWGWFSVLLYLWGKFKERVGEPPPAEVRNGAPSSSVRSPVRDGIVAVLCLGLVGGMAVFIATHPARDWKQNLVTGGLIILSVPVAFAIVPSIRAEVLRWLRWLLQKRTR
ncbi:MAG: hypothetical protein V4671_12755 [Armatimonadota bacterium]